MSLVVCVPYPWSFSYPERSDASEGTRNQEDQVLSERRPRLGRALRSILHAVPRFGPEMVIAQSSSVGVFVTSERRFMKMMEKRMSPRRSGCHLRCWNLLPTLNFPWHPRSAVEKGPARVEQ